MTVIRHFARQFVNEENHMSRRLLVVALVGLLTPLCHAQNTDRNAAMQRLQSRFESAPGVGQPLPNVKVYDSGGKPVALSSLKGQYTVLVFGCLT